MIRDHALTLYERSALRHNHLCPRQVLGVRMGMLAAICLNLELPQSDKRLLTIVETDGCFADGIAVSTGCEIGRRTLRLYDYGKVAATFIDTQTEDAIRIVPHHKSRQHAKAFCPDSQSTWHAYLEAYQKLPDTDLFSVTHVDLSFSLKALISEPHLRAICAHCGEEVINGREVVQDDQTLCIPCAKGAYFINH